MLTLFMACPKVNFKVSISAYPARFFSTSPSTDFFNFEWKFVCLKENEIFQTRVIESKLGSVELVLFRFVVNPLFGKLVDSDIDPRTFGNNKI